jgi:hypothetical protein
MPRLDSFRYEAIATILALLVCLGERAWAQPTSDRPDYKVGDKWTYRMVETVADKTSEWSREITEVGPGNRLLVRLEDGKTNEYDDAMNFAPTGPEDARVLVKFPLKVGASWTFTFKPNTTSNIRENGEAKVVTYESITVPAGKFDCYRVDAKSTAAVRAYNATRQWSRWYCPAIKWIAKEQLETNVFDPTKGGGTRTVATSELTTFSPAK